MALEQRIESLKRQRAEISEQIHAETSHPAPDLVRLHKLKQQRLYLKDEMLNLYHEREKAA